LLKKKNPIVAVVQPSSYSNRPDDEHKNLGVALSYIDRAADKAANIICLPEGYPGPFAGPVNWSPVEEISRKARERGVYVIAGMVELVRKPNYYFTTELLFGPDGKIVGKYRRQPAGPRAYDLLCPAPYEKIMVPGNEPNPVFETEYGKIGIVVCSEIFSPEQTRVVALNGAEIAFFPSGGYFKTATYDLNDTWRTMIWARAIENLMYVAVTQHMFAGIPEPGLATIAGPEKVLCQLKTEGLLTAKLDLSRIEYLRNTDQVFPNHPACMPGKSSSLTPFTFKGMPYGRRPELYRAITKKRAKVHALGKGR
jgi:predicted amidohydrolase